MHSIVDFQVSGDLKETGKTRNIPDADSKTVDLHTFLSYKFHNTIRMIHWQTASPCAEATASAIAIVSETPLTGCDVWWLKMAAAPRSGAYAKQSTVAKLAGVAFWWICIK